jgi:hypothetical protein
MNGLLSAHQIKSGMFRYHPLNADPEARAINREFRAILSAWKKQQYICAWINAVSVLIPVFPLLPLSRDIPPS